jgi:uncharacterized protein (TIGR02466 family)
LSIIGLFPTALGVYKLNRSLYPEEINFTLQCFNSKVFTGTNCISNDTFILNSKEMSAIRAFIENSIDQYLKEVDPFPNNASLYITQSWFTFTEKEQYHHIHNHPNSYLSGVLYFNVDPDSGKIFFKNPKIKELLIEKSRYTPFNSDEWSITPEVGTLLLFPSYIEHYVKDYQGSKPRVSLAFNTFVKGQLGSERALTDLKL